MFNLKSWAVVPVFAVSLLIGSCGSDEPDGPKPDQKPVSITVEPAKTVTLNHESQTASVSVTSTADWSVASDADWCKVFPTGGIRNETTNVSISVTAIKDELTARVATLTIKSGSATETITVTQEPKGAVVVSTTSMLFGGQGGVQNITVKTNTDWTLVPAAEWLAISPSKGAAGDHEVSVTVAEYKGDADRSAAIAVYAGDEKVSEIAVTQLTDAMNIPEGYTLVWHDEFDKDGKPGSDWVIENQNAGWVNNELQTYTSREVDGKLTLEAKDGFLNVNCFKARDGKIYSGRMNAKPATGWQYGYVEARINLPKGKGTWPAFWMMPSNVDWGTDPWPFCGEIDIMEEVGVNANYVSSSVHTGNYNHTKGTQKTHEMYLPGAEGEFHVYAMEWDETRLTTYVDGKVQLSITKAQLGSDHASWPFDRPFYPIVNLAWGGDWGGWNGVDESALPITMKVDYVRIFQKK